MYTQVPGVSHAYVKRNDPNNLIDLVSPGGSPSNPVSRGTDVYAFLDDVSSSNKDTMDQALKIMKSMAPEASNSTELQRGVLLENLNKAIATKKQLKDIGMSTEYVDKQIKILQDKMETLDK